MSNRSRTLKTFKSGYLQVVVHENWENGNRYIDVVLYRKIKVREDGEMKSRYKRGTNLKPVDVSHLVLLSQEVQAFLDNL